MYRASTIGIALTFFVTILASDPAVGDQPRMIAGQTLETLVAQLADSQRVIRLRAAKTMGVLARLPTGEVDESVCDALIEALDHDDRAVRFIVAEHLGMLGGTSLTRAKPKLSELATDESSLGPQMAASFALCRAGDVKTHLPLLIQTLEHPERGVACSAAALIGKIGPAAKAAISALETVHQQHRPGVQGGDYHRGGAAMNALRKIRGEDSSRE